MNTGQRHRVKEVFLSAADLPRAELRRFLDSACEGDAEVRAEVESLLAADALPPLEAGSEGVLRPRGFGAGMLGRRVGHYEIKSLIGEGGMGVVYAAEQEQPRRVVALKVMRTGIASTSALRRFKDESQTLARLEHEGIARIYESGVHDAGGECVPYFAMEYIAGAKPITEYAREKGLSTRDKLALFATVCDAVHYGHQKAVIHRDLKPQNILVGSSGVAKVIDFGVARSVVSDHAATTLSTGVGHLIGTLLYMSPEQLDGEPQDLDTRSDVYALGVVLYELLAECRPYNIGSATLPGAVKAIWEHPPARLSGINRQLRGDVETITLKAMEKDRGRRYQSAAELAADVRRYLNDEPIEARRASRRYLVGMFVRKNKAVCAWAAAAVLGLTSGLVVAIVAWERAVSARLETREFNDLIVQFLQSRDAADAVRLAERVLWRQQTVHSGNHETVAASLGILANALVRQDQPGKAVDVQTQALRMYEVLNPGNHPVVAGNLMFLGYMLHVHGLATDVADPQRVERFKEARQRYRESIDMRKKLFNHPDVRKHLESLEIDLARLQPGDDPAIASALNGLGWVQLSLKQYGDAKEAFLQSVEMEARISGKSELRIVQYLTETADKLRESDPEGATSVYQMARSIQLRLEGKE